MANFNEKMYLNLDAIKDFIFEEEKRNSDVEVTETMGASGGEKLETVSKVIREVKSSDFSNKQTIKYDMIKMFIDILDNVETSQEIAPLTLGQKMTLNTMASYGLIKEING